MRALFALALLILAGLPARAQDVVVYCSALIDWCQVMGAEFTRSTGIKAVVQQKGSGEFLAQIRAEKANPRGDVWWAGTGDPHLQAAEEDLTEEYRSAALDKLQPWARRQAEQSKFRTVGIYAGVLGFAWNTELAAKNKLEAPRCWSDLVKPAYRDEVQISNPASSGTAYTAVASLVQVMGEEPAFAYLKQLHRNVGQYTRSGPAPARNVARGETTVGVMFLHDAVAEAIEGFPVQVAAPCEGTGYEIGSMSLIKGGPNPANAKRWYEFALTPAAQALAVKGKSYQTPSHVEAPVPPQAPKLSETKLIDYDFAKYGTSDERKRLIDRWQREVGNTPK